MDEKREDVKSKAEEEAEPDDEGWVTISRNSKKKSTIGAGRSEKVKARLKAREAKKRKNRELRNFYKFQLKETKLKKLSDLREKFEVDKERQRKMIADRKFRPSQIQKIKHIPNAKMLNLLRAMQMTNFDCYDDIRESPTISKGHKENNIVNIAEILDFQTSLGFPK